MITTPLLFYVRISGLERYLWDKDTVYLAMWEGKHRIRRLSFNHFLSIYFMQKS